MTKREAKVLAKQSMESEILSEAVKFELRRFAVVFGIGSEEWEIDREHYGWGAYYLNKISNISHYIVLRDDGRWSFFLIGEGEALVDSCRVSLYDSVWKYDLANSPVYNEVMARTLYLLGFEDEDIVEQLPRVSAHHKMELRLTHPREFWPPKWWHEEPL